MFKMTSFFAVAGFRGGGRGGGPARRARAVRGARRRAGLPAEPAAAVQRRAAALDHRALGQGQPGLSLPPRLQEVPQRWVLLTVMSLNTLFHVFRDVSNSQTNTDFRTNFLASIFKLHAFAVANPAVYF